LILKRNKKSEHKVLPILGFTSFYNKNKIHILAKNKDGWFKLVQTISSLNSKEHYEKYKSSDIFDEDLEKIKQEKDLLVELSDNNKFKEIYYLDEKDRVFQQIIICSKLKTNIDNQQEIIKNYPEYKKFFDGTNNYFENNVKSINNNDTKFIEQFEFYDIAMPSRLPIFKDDQNKAVNPNDYLTSLCRKGWTERNLNVRLKDNPELKSVYVERIKEELETLNKYNISNYVLLVRDFTNYAKENNARVGLRGSAVGSLVFYLIGVTNIDPVWPDPTIPYDPDKSLLFSRFINKGRLAEGKNALPDVDIDIPIAFRNKLKEYIYKKYGKENTAHIAAFGKIKAKMAIKEVFRIYDKSFDLANEITQNMIDEAKVQDELEDLKQVDPKYNIINYNVDYIENINKYYQENKNEFDKAIRLNNTIRNFSQHAAGLVLADIPLKDFLPIYYDPEKDSEIVALKMQDVEYCGAVKYDLLSVAAYSKIDEICKMVEMNLSEPEIIEYETEESNDI
jgi:DNA polymerase-3 subunit alpha